MKSFIINLLLNFTMAYCLWVGVVNGLDGALNLGLFLAWFAIIMSFFAFSDSAKSARKKVFEHSSIRKHLDTAYDIAVLVFLIWHGFMLTGAFYAVHILITLTIKYKQESDSE